MSKLLEIFGRAITVDTADLIWHWLNALRAGQEEFTGDDVSDLDEIVEHLGNIELEAATEKLNFYLFENPECVFGRMAAVALCIHDNRVEDAIEQLQSVYMRQPSNTMALYSLGFCYERIGKEAEAIEFYQDCIKFKGHLQLPRQRMAAIYFKNGQLDKTIEQYELLTTEHPEDISSLVLLGYLYISSGQTERAVDTFNMAIVSHPDNFHDDSQESEIEDKLEAGRFEEALESVRWL
ncbi:MAG: tetratricopeptide repeat protein, partial [Planctomycetes bacterium]|nr:tetratricopeptide repeat protein [Planctomycetota bacterium]